MPNIENIWFKSVSNVTLSVKKSQGGKVFGQISRKTKDKDGEVVWNNIPLFKGDDFNTLASALLEAGEKIKATA